MILGPDMLESHSIKGSKDADIGLVSKKNRSKKMAPWVVAQSQVNCDKKAKQCTHCDITHRESQTQNEKKIFNLN